MKSIRKDRILKNIIFFGMSVISIGWFKIKYKSNNFFNNKISNHKIN